MSVSSKKPEETVEIPREVQDERRKAFFVILKEEFGDEEPITEDTLFYADLGMESMQAMDLIIEFEEEFSISIPDEVADRFRSKTAKVGDMLNFVLTAPEVEE